MSFAIVTSGSGTSGVAGLNTTGASLIILTLSDTNLGGTPTDTNNNTWTTLTGQTGGFGSTLQFWYCINPTVGAAHGFSNPNGSPAISVVAISNPNPISWDQESGSFNDPNAQPGSITPSQNNAILIASGGTAWFGGAPAIDSGFTLLEHVDLVGGNNFSVSTAVLIQTTATAENPSWTPVAAASSASSVMASFIATAAPSSNLSRLPLLGAG